MFLRCISSQNHRHHRHHHRRPDRFERGRTKTTLFAEKEVARCTMGRIQFSKCFSNRIFTSVSHSLNHVPINQFPLILKWQSGAGPAVYSITKLAVHLFIITVETNYESLSHSLTVSLSLSPFLFLSLSLSVSRALGAKVIHCSILFTI